MKLILSGGGVAAQTEEVYTLYTNLIEKDKPVLYIPIAMDKNSFPSCLEWIKSELKPYNINKIEMLTDIYKINEYNLDKYSSIFIGGGNTYLLLFLLKDSGAFNIILDYIKKGGIVIGGSAGAIIFGKDIQCSDYADENIVNLLDTSGFDLVKGFDICCHYGISNNDNKFEFNFIDNYVAHGNKVFALPEETSLFVENDKVTVIGKKDCTVFTSVVTSLKPNSVYNL
jgi:dipeptidase E